MPKNVGRGLRVERSMGQLLGSSNQPSGMKTQGTDGTWLWVHDIKVLVATVYPSRTGDVKTRRYRLHSGTHSRWVDGSKNEQDSGKEKGREGLTNGLDLKSPPFLPWNSLYS